MAGREGCTTRNVVKKPCWAADRPRPPTFSRSAIPHVRGMRAADCPSTPPYWGHVGIYGKSGRLLARWAWPARLARLEQIEKLEQLRLIEAGIPVGTLPR